DEPTERVVLVGHSTGGLIIRSLLQRSYPLAGEDPAEHVDKVFTYATPQGGIHFDIAGGLLEGVRDLIGFRNSDDFGPDRMYQYLSPDAPALPARAEAPEGFEPRSLDGRFPAERFFSLVGTNAADYGPASRVVGPQSDGLVQVASAYVKGGPRAYVHRSHSGRYGVVNSEEGYQNLRRFLFGDMRVEILLDDLDLAEASAPAAEVFHQAEVQVAVRGLPVLLHDQLLAHHSPIPLEWRKDQEGEPIALFTLFLIRALAGETRVCRYAVHLAVHRLERRQGFLVFADHLEQIPLWADDLVVDLVETAGGYEGRYAWRSQQPRPGADPERDLEPVASGGRWEVRIGLPHGAHAPLGPDATLLMRASPWS
ncbi:MAG: lipase, partial [Actinomycetota bacterium]|nr:lipase [Actinomycetota bacterium]